MKLLIDECLHTSLVTVAHSAGHTGDHVNHRGLSGFEDWELMQVIRAEEYVFVTNNRSDFLELYAKESLHSGLIVIVPNVAIAQQHQLFVAVLEYIGTRDLTNTVVEVLFVDGGVRASEYEHYLPKSKSANQGFFWFCWFCFSVSSMALRKSSTTGTSGDLRRFLPMAR